MPEPTPEQEAAARALDDAAPALGRAAAHVRLAQVTIHTAHGGRARAAAEAARAAAAELRTLITTLDGWADTHQPEARRPERREVARAD